MKYFVLILVVFVSLTSIKGKNIQRTGDIIVVIDDIVNNHGIIRSQLFHNPNNFPTKSEKALRNITGIINHKSSKIIYKNIPFGEYAITVHHDEDNNGFMNRNFLGFPVEGYGLSNNPSILFKLPSYDECKFKLNSKSKPIHIKMKN